MTVERLGKLKLEIAETLKAYHTMRALPDICGELGMSTDDADAGSMSKRDYVLARLNATSETAIPRIAVDVGDRHGNLHLSEAGLAETEAAMPPISEITRRDAARAIDSFGLAGDKGILDFLYCFWPLNRMGDEFTGFLSEEISQHMVRHENDWSTEELFEHLGALTCSHRRIIGMLELAMDPACRRGEKQEALRQTLTPILARDGYVIECSGHVSGYPTYRITPCGGVLSRPKNLIFASTGLKPDIGLSDAVNNDVVILKRADTCLVYDEPIPETGLLWTDMVRWWQARDGDIAEADARKSLGSRLMASLGSDGEQMFFKTYFKSFGKDLGEALPALVPQVYLHYDPATIHQLKGRKRLPRQRMDFLMLLPMRTRIVIEIDGRHHFSRDGEPSLPLYAEMVAADRDLRLAGYEIYRFGANEVVGADAKRRITDFFRRLLTRHGVIHQR